MRKILNLLIILSLTVLLGSCMNNGGKSKLPSFSGYYIESERTVETNIGNGKSRARLNKYADDDSLELGTSLITDEMYANNGEYVFITLQFINEERDTFVDLVLNDSDYGNDRVYDNFSKTNKIHSVETYKLDGKWVSDITIVLPATKTNDVRVIEVTEVNFLKQTINQQVSADLTSKSFSTTLNINIIEEYVPTSKYLFDYKEVTYDDMMGYEITKLNFEDYGYPSIIYFPSYIDGVPVIALGKDITPTDDNLSCNVCVVPETIRYIYCRFLNQCVGFVRDEVYILSHHIIDLEPMDPFFVAGDPTYYVWEDFLFEPRGDGAELKKIGYNWFPEYSKYISLNTGEKLNEENVLQKAMFFKLADEQDGYIFAGYANKDSCTSLVIPSEYNGLPVVAIGDEALDGCFELKELVIPETITVIGTGAIRNCQALNRVVIPSSVTSIGAYAFQDCGFLNSVTISEGVTSIGESAFQGCHSLRSIVLPESIVSIGKSAFQDCDSLSSIVIPESVVSIGESAFQGCYSLTIYCKAQTKPSGWANEWHWEWTKIYWSNEWEYNSSGKPVPLS